MQILRKIAASAVVSATMLLPSVGRSETYALLPTVADGPWECSYYLLNYNTDLADAILAEWFAVDEDESDWIEGIGPFSIDENMFYITPWPSHVRPILIRRHFYLTADELEKVTSSKVTLTCSYDENPTVYLNGRKLWNASGWNDNNYANVSYTSRTMPTFLEGDNVLAVSLMQGAGGGHIDLGLYYEYKESGIEDVCMEMESAGEALPIYDLGGRYLGSEVAALEKGIYIIGGKKTVITK